MHRPRVSHPPFKTARAYARSLKLRTRDEWRSRVKDATARRELEARAIPTRPDVAYHGLGWRGWNDWLGSSRFVAKPFMSFDEWLTWCRAQRFSSKQAYNDWCAASSTRGDEPGERERLRVPSSPESVYRDFPGWRAVLGKDRARVSGRARGNYAAFREARRVARTIAKSHNLKTGTQWRAWARDNRSRLAEFGCPASPDRVAQYQSEFRGWRDFLGVSMHPTQNRKR